ncbi:hypothetical protein TrispH2_011858, partial [Trichoplax sp. H2]
EVILKMSGDQVQSRVKLDQYGRSMFIPGSNRLLIYDKPNVYEYNLQGDKVAWQDISQTKSVDVGSDVTQRNPQTTVNIFDLIEFVGIEDYGKYRQLINRILEEESAAKDWILFRYRKKDNTLILFPIYFSSKARWIITINLTTGMKSVDRLTWSDYAGVVYVDDDYLYVWEMMEDGEYRLKCYKFGDGEHRTQLLQNIKYQEKEGLMCKIMMNYNPHKIEHSPLKMKKEKLVDVWGEKDAEMIANAMTYEHFLLLLENGDHIAILKHDGNLRMKRYKDNIKYFNPLTQFFNHENLWSDKQLILYENPSSLNIYNPQTLQLQITLPFPHFRIWDMQWNLQHSQLIIRSRKDYCLVNPMKKE